MLSKTIFVVRTQPLLPNLPSIMIIICQVVPYGRLEKKDIFKPLALKVVTVAYDRRSLARGFKYGVLTWKLLVSWETGR